MDLVIPLTGRLLTVPLPAGLLPWRRRRLLWISVNALAVKRSGGEPFAEESYVTRIVNTRLEAWNDPRRAADVDSRDAESFRRAWQRPTPAGWLDRLAVMLALARGDRPDARSVAAVLDAFLDHDPCGEDCDLCLLWKAGDPAILARRLDISPQLVADLFAALWAAALVPAPSSAYFRDVLDKAHQPTRGVDGDDEDDEDF
jgi:hypothetical protein